MANMGNEVEGDMNITSKNGFRLFLIFSVLLSSCGSLYDYFFPPEISPELIACLESKGVSSSMLLVNIISLMVGLSGLVALIGIFKFRKWARTLYLITAIVGFAPFYPEIIPLGLTAPIMHISIFLNGMVLGLIYYSPVREYFE